MPAGYISNNYIPDSYDLLTRDESNRYRAFSVFAIIAISISCIGLYGMALFVVTRHGKSIALRKLYGASLTRLFGLLGMLMLRPVLAASLIGLFAASFYNKWWLSQYVEQVPLGTSSFIAAVLLIGLIALATVISLIIRASKRSPVEFLQHE